MEAMRGRKVQRAAMAKTHRATDLKQTFETMTSQQIELTVARSLCLSVSRSLSLSRLLSVEGVWRRKTSHCADVCISSKLKRFA